MGESFKMKGPLTKKLAQFGEDVFRIACQAPSPPEAPGDSEAPATFAIKNPGAFTERRPRHDKSRWMTFHFGDLAVRIRQDGKRLSRENLQVSWTAPDGEPREWRPGRKDKENLGGPFFGLDFLREGAAASGVHAFDPMKGFNAVRSTPWDLVEAVREALRNEFPSDPAEKREKSLMSELERLIQDRPPERLSSWPRAAVAALRRVRKHPPGLLSRSGVTIFLDDSPAWDSKKNWLARRDLHPAERPIYLVRYGADYPHGLKLMTQLFGPIPEVPDWSLGVWFSCYRKMGEAHFRKAAEAFQKHDLPLDVLVVDTDWHTSLWHGFDWNKRLFPDPKRFADWLKKSGLHAAFNVHPQYIPADNSRLPEFLEKSGAERDIHDVSRVPHPFHRDCQVVDLFDRRQTEAYFEIFHRPIERNGCSMWWVDGTLANADGGDATAWLNELYATGGSPGAQSGSQAETKVARVALSRGHGLGAHRSMIQFTGDTYSQWCVLRQEIESTVLAPNALLGHVSHDIGGFLKGSRDWKSNKPPDDLMVRWVQFGCLSPIMRLHSDHGIREPWRFRRKSFEIMRRFFKLRRTLRPILEDLAKEAHRDGVGMCRPMYYSHPDQEDAYRRPGQYMLGDDILAAPIGAETGDVEYWIPPGTWTHAFKPLTISGPTNIAENVPLETTPLYLRAGSKTEKSTLEKIRTLFELTPDGRPRP